MKAVNQLQPKRAAGQSPCRKGRVSSGPETPAARSRRGYSSGFAFSTKAASLYSGAEYARSMTREEAEALAAQLNSEAPDRSTHRRVVRDNGEAWEVVRILVPRELRRGPLGKTVEVEEKPPQPDDPRHPAQRNAPGAWG